MNPRLALAVSVTGALLLGSAVTGTTSAAWVRQDTLPASKVRAGTMSIGTPTTPTTVPTLNQSTTLVGTSTFSVTDSGAGKHLVQRVAATVTGRPTNTTVSVQVGSTCATGGSTTTASIDRSPADPIHTTTFCVRVESSATATSGNVTLDVTGRQQPSGWSVGPKVVTIPVTIAPSAAAPTPSCASGSATPSNLTFTWTSSGAGATYQVLRKGPNDATYVSVATGVTGTTYTESSSPMGSGQSASYRIRATRNGATSADSPTLTLTRSGNSANYNCVVTTP